MLKACICTIGDEILIGQIVDTNSSMISRRLGEAGVKVTEMLSIGDEHGTILKALKSELSKNDIVICTGGLGPTKDDITKNVLAELTGSKNYVANEAQQEIINEILKSRGIQRLSSNIAQAMVPETCEVIVNRKGTAPIMVFRMSAPEFPHKPVLYSMPGVPFETEAALDDVIADIQKTHSLSSIYHRNIMTFGIPESELSSRISEWEDNLPENIRLAYLPNFLTGVKLRLSIYGGDLESQKEEIDNQIDNLKPILGNAIYSFEEDTLENTLGKLLKREKLTLSVAESCTGGEISHLITTVPGSSSYYLGSVTSYAVEIKNKVLGVPLETVDKYGVVSSEVASAMAEGVRKLMGTDYSVATTGLAGPGGDEYNEEGTVWIGVSSRTQTKTLKLVFKNDRKRNIQRFAASALFFLLNFIKSEINN